MRRHDATKSSAPSRGSFFLEIPVRHAGSGRRFGSFSAEPATELRGGRVIREGAREDTDRLSRSVYLLDDAEEWTSNDEAALYFAYSSGATTRRYL
jgi:hypothetical protein